MNDLIQSLRSFAVLMTLLSAMPLAAAEQAWDFEALDRQAQALAQGEYRPSPPLPTTLQDLDYDDYRLIAFEHERAIWKADQRPFWIECFHRGYLYRDKVSLHLLEEGHPHELAFTERLFQYRGELAGLDVPDDTGFAGFRVIGKFESSRHPLEIASFLGASYFRAIGDGQVYGTSARGLAVDVGLTKQEEFPVFRAFWIDRPKSGARTLTIFALLDSTSVAGAYRFQLRPGNQTTMDVHARLYFRRVPEKLGLAPLTSMWMWGDGRAAPEGERRPKVHDADGLLVRTADDKWIWRPLGRQDYPSLSHYDFARIQGFGLIQRDRDAEHYRDDEAKYHQRPSVWIEPKRSWSDGAIELLELPADHEGIDNIAAWWAPKQRVGVGEPLELDYRVTFLAGDPESHTLAKTIKTHVLRASGSPTRLQIDFASSAHTKLEAQAVTPKVTAQRGKVSDVRCVRQSDGTWRVSFDIHPTEDAPVELQAQLFRNGQPVTETWRYLCPK